MASPWTNDDIPKKKRLSTLRSHTKPKAFLPSIGEPDEYTTTSDSTDKENEALKEFESSREAYQNMQPASFEDIQQSSMDRNKRVDELLNKITTVDASQDNSKMGHFKPPDNPMIQVRRDMDTNPSDATGGAKLPSFLEATQKMRNVATYTFNADDSRAAPLSSYQKSYEAPPVLAPYYTRQMGAGSKGNYNDSKLMEKINYMIHMLEAQQTEKTSNITEEFILYTFLGVFIIYIVDSFSRAGKYTR